MTTSSGKSEDRGDAILSGATDGDWTNGHSPMRIHRHREHTGTRPRTGPSTPPAHIPEPFSEVGAYDPSERIQALLRRRSEQSTAPSPAYKRRTYLCLCRSRMSTDIFVQNCSLLITLTFLATRRKASRSGRGSMRIGINASRKPAEPRPCGSHGLHKKGPISYLQVNNRHIHLFEISLPQ